MAVNWCSCGATLTPSMSLGAAYWWHTDTVGLAARNCPVVKATGDGIAAPFHDSGDHRDTTMSLEVGFKSLCRQHVTDLCFLASKVGKAWQIKPCLRLYKEGECFKTISSTLPVS